MMGTTIALRRRRRRGHDTVGDDSASVPSSVVIARASSAADVMPLRERVMYPGQPERCAQEDDDDDTTIHLVARIVAPIATAEDASSTASIVGVISVYPNADGTDGKEAIFRKLAVAPEYQGLGIGRALIGAAATEASAVGCTRLFCHVRESAGVEEFYVGSGLGFSRRGGRFERYGRDDILELETRLMARPAGAQT